mmetsp:Transcript_27289/g.44774  ORF Transcript_27289/g.44774 Transcript_27289/m.44774 type:complete len:383 (+) Transcript_27289:186-1334(+)
MTSNKNDTQERIIPCRDRFIPYGDDEAILKAFREDGYVVVSNVLSPVEVEATLNEIWTSKNLLGQFDRHNPGTWSDPSWPQQTGGRNFLALRDVFHDGCNWDIASPPRQYHLHKLLWGRDDLIMSSLDRSGVMRPSEYTIKWKTDTNWLHRYHNPWTKPGFSHVQAIICLTESTPTSGGFACVPGFHKRFQQWGDDHPMGSVALNGKKMNESYGDGQPLPVPVDDPCQQEIIQALAPAGSMILWDSRLPHQNVPNVDDTSFRVVFYCNMVVSTALVMEHRRNLLVQKRILLDLQDNPGKRFPHNLSALGNQLHGWTESGVPLSDASAEFGIDDRESFLGAAGLVREAGIAEEVGDISASIRKHQAASRAFPDIEAWYNVIFG